MLYKFKSKNAGDVIMLEANGRKVLEVAMWNARRHHRRAAPLDLLRGVISDGKDPVCARLWFDHDESSRHPLVVLLAKLDDMTAQRVS